MAPQTTVHIIRHAEGFHQLPRDHPEVSIHDPSLTPHGIASSEELGHIYPYHTSTELICASPLRRAIQTASLAFAPEMYRGLKILLVPDAQETTDAPADTGSDPAKLIAEFGDMIDASMLKEDWYSKSGSNGVDNDSLRERACQLRRFLRGRIEEDIVLVTHGAFAHYITENVDLGGHQTGEYWYNAMWRTFTFESAEDRDATFLETDESHRRHST